MARLHYHRWLEQFIVNEFSSEDSMRDYLFSNPTLIFEEDTWVIPIVEEKCLPLSSLDKKYGRADIILCRILEDDEQVKKQKKLSLSLIELWIVELKKKEASYENGFRQLFDYMAIVKNDNKIQKDIKNEIVKCLDIEGLQLKDPDTSLGIYGSLVAPSFDLIGRMRESISKNVKSCKKDYEDLDKVLKDKGKIDEGFTLIDVINAACKLFPYLSLIKLIRFKRGDEIIIYSENILGRKAAAQISRVDPVELFKNGTIKEDDIFYFKDDKGKEHKEVECRVLNKRGQSHSFMIKIVTVKGQSNISVPKWAKDHYDYKVQKIPIDNTAKTCSIALHKLFGIYGEDELLKYYWNFGEKDFVRRSDGKLLSELREEQRLNVS